MNTTLWTDQDSTHQIALEIGRALRPRHGKGKYPCIRPKFVAAAQAWTRCRKCRNCQMARQWLWFWRAWEEIWTAQRTWFLTLTLRPGAEQTPYQEVQKWIRDFRQEFKLNQRGRIRYLMVNDYGEQSTQRKHYHGLLHCNADLRKDDIFRSWKHGYTDCVLIKDINPRYGKLMVEKTVDWDSEAFERARYCAAYCGKGNKGRIRASIGYGTGFRAHQVGIVETITGLDIPF